VVRLDRRRQGAHVGHGPLLLAALHGVQQVRNRDRRQDPDDRDDDQQLDQCESALAFGHKKSGPDGTPGPLLRRF
jgi:hypothetical protein